MQTRVHRGAFDYKPRRNSAKVEKHNTAWCNKVTMVVYADRKRNAWGVSEQKAAISVQVSV